jgi:hypothetical protein
VAFSRNYRIDGDIIAMMANILHSGNCYAVKNSVCLFIYLFVALRFVHRASRLLGRCALPLELLHQFFLVMDFFFFFEIESPELFTWG